MSFKKEKITELKLQHGENLHLIKLDNGKSAIVRRPTLRELEATQSLAAQGQFITYNISLFRTCFIEGDNCSDNDYDLMAMASKMADITEVATSTVEKL